ncbi:hypothetical protein BCV70DRAFT_205446 [Testicularia cyperi]|uniref:Uncharacterized protein n=1 Tax=Testicularia cyperi TaxID=1882483 RepID=A0A317XV95_9BASI|nr:hypothetical protein BCV70DRAFT_205446 [Testicularia cyperi]
MESVTLPYRSTYRFNATRLSCIDFDQIGESGPFFTVAALGLTKSLDETRATTKAEWTSIGCQVSENNGAFPMHEAPKFCLACSMGTLPGLFLLTDHAAIASSPADGRRSHTTRTILYSASIVDNLEWQPLLYWHQIGLTPLANDCASVDRCCETHYWELHEEPAAWIALQRAENPVALTGKASKIGILREVPQAEWLAVAHGVVRNLGPKSSHLESPFARPANTSSCGQSQSTLNILSSSVRAIGAMIEPFLGRRSHYSSVEHRWRESWQGALSYLPARPD